jgi:hypothetical protein
MASYVVSSHNGGSIRPICARWESSPVIVTTKVIRHHCSTAAADEKQFAFMTD